MKQILYCSDKSSTKKISLPFTFETVSKVKDVFQKEQPLVILEEEFLGKRKKINPTYLRNKLCFIHFAKENKDNLKKVRDLGFFDYFTDENNKNDILFKLERAGKFLELKKQISSLENHLLTKDKKIEKITLTDPLTGCYNWRYLLQRIHQELNSSHRDSHSVSFIGCDIDHFQQVNEIYGVKVADKVIKELVSILRMNLKKEDTLSRWREDEFFLIIPHSDNISALEAAKRIREKISFHKFKYKEVVLSVKVSVGVVSFPEDNVFNSRDVVSALSVCLTRAKRKGGNIVMPYSPIAIKPSSEPKKKANVKELRRKIEKMNVLLTRDLLEMIYGFARAIEAKDSYTGKHVEHTAAIAEKIAKSLSLSKNEVENIKNAAVLHDLGKVGIKEKILSKKGALSTREKEIIKVHPSIAADILKEIHALKGSIPAILYHHEYYNGKGYPLGLKGEEIPLSARIVAIADVYQALISDRPYRKAYSPKKALGIIKKESGKQFDPQIVEAFLRIIDKINEKK
ncbi:MAG: diguanylate cyclase [Candidatus Omnitrophica bacterium]|nr:diguanylate cyclase [Candidatus Omnitrophota bacterium]